MQLKGNNVNLNLGHTILLSVPLWTWQGEGRAATPTNPMGTACGSRDGNGLYLVLPDFPREEP